MGSPFSFTLIILLSLTSVRVEAQGIRSARLLDLLIRDYALKSSGVRFKTGMVHTVHLPANFSGIKVDAVRFRCGSLRRYGAQVKEFHLGIGVTLQPCAERLVVIRQNLDLNWSPIYYANYDLSGYQLVSPILGLLAYNFGSDVNVSDSFEIGIHAGEKPITIDFSNASTTANVSGVRPLCASFENDGRVIIKGPESLFVCGAKRHGHYGLVIKSPPAPPPSMRMIKRKISLWKVVAGSSVGTALGVFLLGMLFVAMFVQVKKKARMEEMERRAYEEEALQVSMVGHVRAPTATVTRTTPIIEHGFLQASMEKGAFLIGKWKPIKVSSQSELVKPLLATEVCFSTLSLSAQSWSKGNWEVLVNKKRIRHKNSNKLMTTTSLKVSDSLNLNDNQESVLGCC